jgi:hypothetical protein
MEEEEIIVIWKRKYGLGKREEEDEIWNKN